jgi:hypothetical protein
MGFMISGGAEGMTICDPCVRIRETVLILLRENGEKSGAGRSCLLVFRVGGGGGCRNWDRVSVSVKYIYIYICVSL